MKSFMLVVKCCECENKEHRTFPTKEHLESRRKHLLNRPWRCPKHWNMSLRAAQHCIQMFEDFTSKGESNAHDAATKEVDAVARLNLFHEACKDFSMACINAETAFALLRLIDD